MSTDDIIKQTDQEKAGWISLADAPTKENANIICLNETEFLMASDTTNSNNINGIHKYNIHNDKWDIFKKYDGEFVSKIGALTHDERRNKLYLYGEAGSVYYLSNDDGDSRLSIIDINSDENEEFITIKVQSVGGYAYIIFAEDHCHLIGGRKNKYHWIFNSDKQIFEQKHALKLKSGNYLGGLIYVKSKKQLLLFGGWDEGCIDNIYIYSFDNDKWIQSDIRLPLKIQFFGSVLTGDERFVLIFGGWVSDGRGDIDDIHIWNLETMDIIKSKIRCPEEGGFYVVVTDNNYKKKDILVYGYLMKCCGERENMPHDIVKLIVKWYCDSFVHLVNRETASHWKIEIDKLFS